MRTTALLSAATAVALAGAALPAVAADPAPAAGGVATSGITLLDVSAGGRTAALATVATVADTLRAADVAEVQITPLTVDGTAVGQRTVTPDDSPVSTPSVSQAVTAPVLGELVGLRSPVLTAAAETPAAGPLTSVTASDLGGLSVLGLPVALAGSLDVGSAVTAAQGSSTKTLTVTDLALPSIADLLGELGLDLSALPVEVLDRLVSELDLVDSAVTEADAALDAAQEQVQDQVDAATEELQEQQAALAAAEAQVADLTEAAAAADALVAARQTAADTALDQLDEAKVNLASVLAANPACATVLSLACTAAQTSVTNAQAAFDAASTDLANAKTAAAAAQAALDAAKAAVALAQGLVDAAQGVLAGLTSALVDEVQALVGALLAVLDGTPLVSIDSLEVTTRSVVTGAGAGQQEATVVGGEVVGLRVLGTDVLDDVLGTTRLDVLELTGTTLGQVTGVIGALTGTLSEVLSTVPAFPQLQVPAPTVELLTKTTSTGVVDGFGTASTGVRALQVTIPAITVPDLSLPAVGGVVPLAAPTVSQPVTLAVGALTDQVRFNAASATPATGTPVTGAGPTTAAPTSAAPTTTRGTLPATGASTTLGATAVALVLAALAVSRRRTEELAEEA